MNTIKILWIAPVLNHYKIHTLNHLSKDSLFNLTVFTGDRLNKIRTDGLINDLGFKIIHSGVDKSKFGFSYKVINKISSKMVHYDWIMIPAEKKFLFLLFFLKLKNFNIKFFSYNHPPNQSNSSFLNLFVFKLIYNMLDLIVFYTENSFEKSKAILDYSKNNFSWANNTIDTSLIEKNYTFSYPPDDKKVILFIGRLIPSKKVLKFILYFRELKKHIPNLYAEIIGDGPQKKIIENIASNDQSITIHGKLIDEKNISEIMKRSSLIFVPGDSGLSINHTFAYGRPYFTLQKANHGPEISYIQRNFNGFILDQSFKANVRTITSILTDQNKLNHFCYNAKKKSEYLSIENWVKQLKNSILNASK